jgi:hypothetical protein
MILRKILTYLLGVLPVIAANAQKKIILENIWLGTNCNYLLDADMRSVFARQLNAILLKHQLLPLSDTSDVKLVDLSTKAGPAYQPKFYGGDTSDLHLNISVAEYTPRIFFSSIPMTESDTVLSKNAKTVFRLRARLEKYNNETVYEGMLDMVVSAGKGPGMGNESVLVFIMPKTFTEIMKTGLNLMLDPANDLTQVSLSVAPAFSVDEYVFPKLGGRTRIPVTTSKEVSQYVYNDSRHLLRSGQSVYEEITYKGKKAKTYPAALLATIKQRHNYENSDFVFLKQESRDVLNDKNYLLKLVVQIDPESPYISPEIAFTNFIHGDMQMLLSDADTLAKFTIRKDVVVPRVKIYPGRIYNGVDTTRIFRIPNITQEWGLTYAYVISGSLQQHSFEIKTSGVRNALKEIYLDGNLVSIAQGRYMPEIFVVFDASLSTQLLNQLFLIGFNHFLE